MKKVTFELYENYDDVIVVTVIGRCFGTTNVFGGGVLGLVDKDEYHYKMIKQQNGKHKFVEVE